ncbi:MAG: DUF3093 domain-containing protein [Microbacteriaceae bacterium]
MSGKNSATAVEYEEKVAPSLALYLPVLFVFPAVLLVILPIGGWQPAILIGASFTGLTAFGVSKLGHRISIASTDAGPMLQVGQARISVQHLGTFTVISGAELRTAAGPSLHALSYRKLQPHTGHLVQIDVTDDADPTPYWIFSSRKPEALRDAYLKAKSN